MCAQHFSKSKVKSNTSLLYLIAILLGVMAGLLGPIPLQNLGLMISDIFIKIFKCVSLPLIALSIIVTLSQYTDNTDMKMKRIWRRTLFYTIGTTLVAASVACALYLIISPSNISSSIVVPSTIQTTNQTSYLDYLVNLIPNNIFSPFLEHQVISALLVSVIVGFAIRKIPNKEAHVAITNLFKGLHSIFIVITGWIVKIIPLALFGFIATTIIQIKSGLEIRGLGGYLAIIILANLIQGFVLLPLFLYMNKINPFATMKSMLPALSVAFFTKSSAATLPITIETAESNMGISPSVSRFALPLCTSINMNGCAAFIFATVIYLMQNNGVEISLLTMLLWIFIATIAAVGNAGVPMGCFFLSASLLTSLDIPISLLGLILPFYSIIDMIETALNVWSDCCVVKVVDDRLKQEQFEKQGILITTS